MSIRIRRLCGILAVSGLSNATTVSADTILVPGDYPTVVAAISNATSGDEIVVSAGVWTATGGFNFGAKRLHLRSASGPDSTVLTIGSFLSARVLTLADAGNAGSSIEGFTVTGGRMDSGGGLLVANGANVSVSDCVFEGNEALVGNGGGVRVTSSSSIDISDCIFRDNTATGEGGGLCIEADGGFVVQRCRFEGNDAGGNGGGASVGAETMLDKGESFPRILNSIFTGNISGESGGGAYVYSARVDCPFKGPGTCRSGGVYGCTFSANTASIGGAVDGGRAFELGNALNVVNCILSNNVGDYGTTDFGGLEVVLWPDFLHCCVDFLSSEQASAFDSIAATPRFVSEYGSDGKPGTGDEFLNVLPGSPVVDAGYVYVGGSAILNGDFDVDGNPRVADSVFVDDTGVRESPFPGPVVDMGAFEFVDSSVLGNLAVWIGNGGVFDADANWYDGVGPGLSTGTWLDGDDDAPVSTTLPGSILIGELYANSGTWSIQGTGTGPIDVVSVRRDGPMGKEPGAIFIGPFAGERSSLRFERLDVACEQVVVARGEFEMAPEPDGPEVELTAASVIIATDGDSGLASTYRGRGIVTTTPLGILPSFWNLGVTQATGPLTIDGNYYQSGGVTFPGIVGRLRFDLAEAGQNVSVLGRATLGGPVEFIVDPDNPPSLTPGDVFTVLTATDGFDGSTFAFASSQGLGEGVFITLTTSEAATGPGSSVVATVNSASELLLGSSSSGTTDAVADFVIEDVNGDGAGDLVLSVPDATSPTGVAGDVVVLLNQGSSGGSWGGFSGTAISIPVGTQPAGLDAGDLDGDGDIDIAVANRISGTISILLNDGNDPPAFTTQDIDSSPSLSGSADPLDVYIGNLDGSNFPDLLVTNAADGLTVAFQNQTTFVGGGFSSDGGTESDPETTITKFDPGDADGKDREDRVVGASKNGNTVSFGSKASALGTGINIVWNSAPVGAQPVDLARGDFDNDTVEDVVTVNEAGGTISILIGDGTEFLPASTVSVGDDPVSVDVGDLDGDGDDDIAVVCRNAGGQLVVRTVQNMLVPSGQLGFLVLSNDDLAGQAPSLLRIADVDEDGSIADVVAITSSSAFEGGAVDGFSALLGLGEAPVCVGDLNGDQQVDAADLGIAIAAWAIKGESAADLNGDLLVDAADLGFLIASWGPCPQTQ